MATFDNFRDSLANGDSSSVIKKYFGDNPLFTALKLGEQGSHWNCPLDVVKKLLHHGADVNYADELGDSCLHMAVKYSSNEEVILELLKSGADVNKPRRNGFTPLLVLLSRKDCSASVVRLLIEYGAYVNCFDVHGETALAAATRNSKDDTVVQILLEAGANFDNIGNLKNYPLLILLRRNCSSHMVGLFLRYGADVNCEDEDGYSPLAVAIKHSRNEKVIQALLEGGADVNKLDSLRRSPLCIAFQSPSHDIIKMLLDAGCSPRACKHHYTPLFCAIQFTKSGLREDILDRILKEPFDVNSHEEHGVPVFCHAVSNAATVQDLELLLKKGVSFRDCRMHVSPLHCVAFSLILRESVVKLLIERGAGVEGKGWAILRSALKTNYEVGAIQLLLDLPGMMDCAIEGNGGEESILHIDSCCE